jgi:hypothetical protein
MRKRRIWVIASVGLELHRQFGNRILLYDSVTVRTPPGRSH